MSDDYHYRIAKDIVQRVIAEIPIGRVACYPDCAAEAAMKIKEAGDGDHLEIGVLFGGSLIIAALVKKAFGLKGLCIGVDPLDGYYPPGGYHPDGKYSEAMGIYSRPRDIRTDEPVTLKSVVTNINYFDVVKEIKIIKAFSVPWPTLLENSEFASAFIDGDHWGDGPKTDFANVAPHIRKGGIVIFDDYTHQFPAVQKAVMIARRMDGWKEIGSNRQNYFIQRKEDEAC